MVRWAGLVLAMSVTRLGAQSAGSSSAVPEAYRPPPGMCRIWIDGVPPDRQPAPTDCATAVRRRPANAHVVFGDLSTYVAPADPPGGSQSQAAPASPPAAPRTTTPGSAPLSKDPPAEPSKPEQRTEPRPAAPPSANPPARPSSQSDPRLAPLPNHATPIRPPAQHPGSVQPSSPTRTITPPAPKQAPPAGHPPGRAS